MSAKPVDLLISPATMTELVRHAAGYARLLKQKIQQVVENTTCPAEAAHEMRILTRKCTVAARLINRAGAGIHCSNLRNSLRTLRKTLGALRQAELLLELYTEHCSSRKKPAPLLAALQLNWQQAFHCAREQVRTFQKSCFQQLDDMLKKIEKRHSRLSKYHWRKKDDRWFARQLHRWEKRSTALSNDSNELHRFRIKTKQFRYLCLFLNEPLQRDKDWQKRLRLLEKLQDNLGGYRDVEQTMQWLEQFEQGLAARGTPDQHLLASCRAWYRHCEQSQRRYAKAIDAWRKTFKAGKSLSKKSKQPRTSDD